MATILRILILCITVSFNSISQSKEVTEESQIWTQYFVAAKITNHWGVQADIGHRRKQNFVSVPFQNLFRLGGIYYFNDNAFLTCGYAYFENYNDKGTLPVPEHRGWQRFTTSHYSGRFQFMHRYRFEQRFRQNFKDEELLPSYRFNYRAGYQLNIQHPLKGNKILPKTPFLILFDEVFINFGDQIVTNMFDQNRIYGGFGYQINKALSVNAGYMYTFTQRSKAGNFNEAHVLRFTLIHNLDFRKTED
mgnify:CR=1 FL=1